MHYLSSILFVYISIFDMQNDKAKHFHLLSSVKIERLLKIMHREWNVWAQRWNSKNK